MRLTIISSGSVVSFAKRIEEYWNAKYGETQIMDSMELGSHGIPPHDLLLLRFGAPRGGYLIEEIRGHVRSHKCDPVNSVNCIEDSADKYTANEMAKTVMRAPITAKIGMYEIEDKRLRERVASKVQFPAFLKPQFSSGGHNIHSYGTPERFINAKDYETIEHQELFSGNWILQEAIPFDKLIRAVWIEGEGLVDAVYDIPDYGKKYTIRIKLGENSRVYKSRGTGLEAVCEKMANKFSARHLVIDLFEKDGEYIFNEVNNSTRLWWLTKHSGVAHALLITQLMNRIGRQ